MTTEQVVVTCPQCYHQGKYWLKSVESGEATCHLCEAPLQEEDIAIG